MPLVKGRRTLAGTAARTAWLWPFPAFERPRPRPRPRQVAVKTYLRKLLVDMQVGRASADGERCDAMRCGAMGAQPFAHRSAAFVSLRCGLDANVRKASSLLARVQIIASTAQNNRTASTAVSGAVTAGGACVRVRGLPRAFATVCATHPRHPSTVGQVWKGVLREVEVLKILSHENVIQLCAPRPKQSRLLVVLGVLGVLGVCSDTCAVAWAPIRFA